MSRIYRLGYDAFSNFWQLERDELRTSDDGGLFCQVKAVFVMKQVHPAIKFILYLFSELHFTFECTLVFASL